MCSPLALDFRLLEPLAPTPPPTDISDSDPDPAPQVFPSGTRPSNPGRGCIRAPRPRAPCERIFRRSTIPGSRCGTLRGRARPYPRCTTASRASSPPSSPRCTAASRGRTSASCSSATPPRSSRSRTSWSATESSRFGPLAVRLLCWTARVPLQRRRETARRGTRSVVVGRRACWPMVGT